MATETITVGPYRPNGSADLPLTMNRLTSRCNTVRRACADERIDALLITHLPNIAYLTGLRASAAALLVAQDRVVLIADSRYITSATDLIETGTVPSGLSLVPVTGSYDETIATVLQAAPRSRVAVESQHVSVHRWNWLTAAIGCYVTLVPSEGVVESGRLTKDADEVETFRLAGTMLAKCVAPALTAVRRGRSEREIAADIEYILASHGFEDRAFPTIVASGPNSALPHARPSERRLTTGDLVLLDFGGVYAGYCVDISRTACVGSANSESKRLHAAVLEAQQEAIDAVRPGVVASEIDSSARSVLKRHGLADAFGHSTGHGLGLEVHEAPRIGRVSEPGTDRTVSSGMVFTIEPGVYVPGSGGVRIEDDILVTEKGCEVLTQTSRDLVVCDAQS